MEQLALVVVCAVIRNLVDDFQLGVARSLKVLHYFCIAVIDLKDRTNANMELTTAMLMKSVKT